MIARILVNWPYKLAAVLIAISLRFYVAAQLNPHSSITVTIHVIGLPSNLILASGPGTVHIDLSGSPAASLRQSDVIAEVDLSNSHAGKTGQLPIAVSLNPDLPPDTRAQIAVDSKTPATISYVLDPLVTERKLVHLHFDHVAPAGYLFGSPSVNPNIVEVQGRQESLDRVDVVAADVAIPDDEPELNPLPITGDFDVAARGADGHPMDGVTVNPAQVHVSVPLVRAASTKIVPIAPTLSAPAFNYRIADASVSPAFLTVSGTSDALTHVAVVMTEPVDVTGESHEVTRYVHLIVPNGLTAVGPTTVSVDVKIAPVSPPGGQAGKSKLKAAQ